MCDRIKQPEEPLASCDGEPRYDYEDEGGSAPRRQKAASRRAKALNDQKRLQAQKGQELSPVAPVKARDLVQNFWAKAWCRNLDRYEDYVLRLARGRSYVRNGCLLDLAITEGEICACVSGAELHRVDIRIATLSSEAWQRLVEASVGRIGSLLELLDGTLKEQTLEIFSDPAFGLFPDPGEIRFTCDCLDVARMCEHVAAALYGVAVRLDTSPELFFTLRGVDKGELMRRSTSGLKELTDEAARSLDHQEMEDLFGIDIL